MRTLLLLALAGPAFAGAPVDFRENPAPTQAPKVEETAPAAPAPGQQWTWPDHKRASQLGHAWREDFGQGRSEDGYEVVGQRVERWLPSAPADQQVEYSLIMRNGRQERVNELQLEGRKAELAIQRENEKAARIAREAAERQAAIIQRRYDMNRTNPIVSQRLLKHDESKPYGQRNTWEYTRSDGTKEVGLASPLVFDLKGGGVKTGPRKVLFDIDGTGRKEAIQWSHDVADGMGVLVFDADHNGKAGETGRELFGDKTVLGTQSGFVDGFAALRALVEDAVKKGVIPNEKLDAPALSALEKAYGLKMKVGGLNHPAVSLAEAGVKEIALSNAPRHRIKDFDGQGNDVSAQPGALFTRADGTPGAYMDVWLFNNADGYDFLKVVKR